MRLRKRVEQGETDGEERFRWTEKCAAQGERSGFFVLGQCYRDGIGCVKDFENAKEHLLVAAELEYLSSMFEFVALLDKDDPQRFVWFGRAAATHGGSSPFSWEMVDQIRNFNSGTGYAKVVFAIGRVLRGHISNEKRTIFGKDYNFDTYIGPATQAQDVYEFQLQSYRGLLDDCWIAEYSCEGHSKDD
jgi:TPR repeat protein